MNETERKVEARCGLIREELEAGRSLDAANFAVYRGPSMIPTLRELDVMQVIPYLQRPVRAGDVVIFLPPGKDQPIVHRVVRVTPHGIRTLGDNNPREDDWLVQPGDILGQVIAAWHGPQWRRIDGGRAGQFYSSWVRLLRVLDRAASRLLRPIYYALAESGILARLLPSFLRPRVVVFRVSGRNQWRLFWGRHIVGRFDSQLGHWIIQRPFRLLIDERMFEPQPADGSSCFGQSDEPIELTHSAHKASPV